MSKYKEKSMRYFVFYPILEIIGFIIMGSAFGLGGAILEIIASFIIGVWLIRRNITSLQNIGINRSTLTSPSSILSGILLILPGIITDVIGITLLLPFIKNIWVSQFATKFSSANSHNNRNQYSAAQKTPSAQNEKESVTIDGEILSKHERNH